MHYSRIFILRLSKDAIPNKESELNWIQVHFAPISRPLFPVELSVHSLDVGLPSQYY